MKDLVKRRKTEVRYCVPLSNGQLLNVYFWRNSEHLTQGWMNGWKVAVIICDTRKQANRWYHHKTAKENNASTGKCGLEGLKITLDILIDFRNNMKLNDVLLVTFSDRKRALAYRRLLKYDFEEYYMDNELLAYGALNPKYWTYSEE